MNVSRICCIALLTASLPWLAACGNENGGSVSAKVQEAMATENIEISDNDQPSAEITPQGDFLIEGREVETTSEQRALLLEYRGHIVYMVETGTALGVKGAGLATDALGDAFASVFTGDTEKVKAKVEAKAEKIAQLAKTELCGHLPAMLETEQKLAASLPEFRPYADLSQDNINDCRAGDDTGVTAVR